MRRSMRVSVLFVVACLSFVGSTVGCSQGDRNAEAKPSAGDSAKSWSLIITAADLEKRLKDPNLLIIDARSEKEYAAGHIPGAINLPVEFWRTPKTKRAPGVIGEHTFRTADGSMDVARYEKILSEAGIKPEHEVVVYGNHGGKADGSVPAGMLLKLGHKKVAFLDGIGVDQWNKAGHELSTEAKTLPASTYKASPEADRLWSAEDIIKNLKNEKVVIVDIRTPAEFAGTDLRGNKRGGHIPGAKNLDVESFLAKDGHTTASIEDARKRIEAVIPKDKKVVIYCQTGNRCTLKELMLRDLGYDVALYDVSFQEWGNREDTPIDKPEAAGEAKAEK